MTWNEIVLDVKENWWLYASMPVVASIIGYVTKLVAIRMMFEPIEFIGIKPYLGWQGIVPRKAAFMASIACDMMTSRLISPADIFGRIDPQRMAQEVEKTLTASVEDMTREVAMQFQPGLWESLPDGFRQAAIRRMQSEAPAVVAQIMRDIQSNIDGVFDLKDMVISNLMRNKPLLNRIFQEVGEEEFRFIARSGIYFGFIIGCVQAFTWALTHSPWIMPMFGGFTGWFTDWLALKMVFRPKKPTKYVFGLFEWQGLFLKRRKEVSARYGALIAEHIITSEAIIEAVLRGPLSDRLYALVSKNVKSTVDEQAGLMRPLASLVIGNDTYREMKQVVADKIMQRLPETLKQAERYIDGAMDVRHTLVSKMQQLNEDEFEQLLRPAFQQDEWILIAVGAALGFLVGEMQVFIMLHH